MKHVVTAFSIIVISFVSSAFFHHLLKPRMRQQEIEFQKIGDRIVVVEDGKFVTYYGKIIEENKNHVTIKATLRLEGRR